MSPVPRTAEQFLDEAWRRGQVLELQVTKRWILARAELDGETRKIRIPIQPEPR